MAKTKNPVPYTTDHDVYVDSIYTKMGDVFVTASDPDDSWVKVDMKALPAMQAASEKVPSDVPLDNLDTAALQAIAAEKNVSTVGIENDKDKLITAIKAANEPAL